MLAENELLSFVETDSGTPGENYTLKPIATGAVLLSSFTGQDYTGAFVRSEKIRIESGTGSAAQLQLDNLNISQELSRSNILTISDKLLEIRKALSVNMTELAKILRVERPTLYAWFKDEASPISANYNRVSQVHKLAKQWMSMSHRPPESMKREPLLSGKSLLDILAEDTINEEEALTAFQKLATSMSTKRETRSALVRRLGYSPLPEEIEESGLIGETEFIS